MGKITGIESFIEAIKNTQGFYTANQELRDYVMQLNIPQPERSELMELIIKQIDALTGLILTLLQQSAKAQGKSIEYSYNVGNDPQQQGGITFKWERPDTAEGNGGEPSPCPFCETTE